MLSYSISLLQFQLTHHSIAASVFDFFGPAAAAPPPFWFSLTFPFCFCCVTPAAAPAALFEVLRSTVVLLLFTTIYYYDEREDIDNSAATAIVTIRTKTFLFKQIKKCYNRTRCANEAIWKLNSGGKRWPLHPMHNLEKPHPGPTHPKDNFGCRSYSRLVNRWLLLLLLLPPVIIIRFLISSRATDRRCTSSGPSAIRNVLMLAQAEAMTVS